MSGRQFQKHMILFFVVLAFLSLAWQRQAWAQTDGWSFVITPQVWITHVANNGFAPKPTLGLSSGFFLIESPSGSGHLVDGTSSGNSDHVGGVSPQWGIQLAAQKSRWTLAGSFQYLNFETRTDVNFTPPPPLDTPKFCLSTINDQHLCAGQRMAQELIETTRIDVDLGASYLFPDVVKGWVDFSLGAGLKLIYASGTRQFSNLNNFVAFLASLPPGEGLYTACKKDDCSDQIFKDRVHVDSWLYGATIPMNATLHLSNDGRWLLPFSVTPFLGAETRNDHNVVYAFNDTLPFKVNRLDGTTFAYGFTGDSLIRYIINDTLSVYAGMRVQYIKGHEKYLAYGPLVGMSVRFGGK